MDVDLKRRGPSKSKCGAEYTYDVYGLFQCRYDVSPDICKACVMDASLKIKEDCPLEPEAIIWYDECMLRYSSNDIFSSSQEFPEAINSSNITVTNYAEFAPVLEDAMETIILKAAAMTPHFASNTTKFATSEYIYSFAQCTPDISVSRCKNCLDNARSSQLEPSYNVSIYVTVLKPSCVLRVCEDTKQNFVEGSIYETNLELLFTSLTTGSSSLRFYTSTAGDGSTEVYGLFQCRYDISLEVCNACVMNATQKITEVCPLFGEAIVWYDVCMLRYADRNIFSKSETSPGANRYVTDNVTNYAEFAPILEVEMNVVIVRASIAPERYASSKALFTSTEYLYSFAQCTPDISTRQCKRCLEYAFSRMTRCCATSVFVLTFRPSCQLRYDTTGPFLNDESSLADAPQSP
ncbi:cysteine-rich repeat secretory protein 57-like [Silene latifolia]|uniref:cysteine-rich repeat secretory protein 57-like n=1 Tax=Silene latifolia TaxID=37657 RepID=UPI003D7819B7